MRHKVVVICPQDLATGFALTGVQTFAYESAAEAQERLVRLLNDGETGVVLVDETAAGAFHAGVLRAAEASDFPVVITVPMGRGPALEREYLEQMIRQVIGYQVRLR